MYDSRPEGSLSKLSTYGDGIKILRLILMLIKHERPLLFFTFLSLLFFILSIFVGAPVVHDFLYDWIGRKTSLSYFRRISNDIIVYKLFFLV